MPALQFCMKWDSCVKCLICGRHSKNVILLFPSQPSVRTQWCLYKGATTIISHYSLHLVLGNLETHTLQGRMVLTSLSYSIRICILAFNKLPVLPHLQSSNMEFPAAYRLGERHKEIYSLPIKCMCQFPRVVIIKYYKLGELKEQILFSQCFGDQMSKVKVFVELCSPQRLQGRTLPCLFQLLAFLGYGSIILVYSHGVLLRASVHHFVWI